MSVGFRVYHEISRAGVSLVERFRGLPVANVSDNMNRLYTMDASIRPVNSVPLLGTAITVNCPSGDNLMVNYALELAQAGDVLVISRGNDDVAFLGSLMARKARNKGLAGIVVDGCVRDLEELKCLEIPVYCRGVSPRGPYKNGPGEVNVPVACGGQVVFPGDIIIGDGDGLIAVHPWDAEQILDAAWAQNAKENELGERLDKTGQYIGIAQQMQDDINKKAEIIFEEWNSFK